MIARLLRVVSLVLLSLALWAGNRDGLACARAADASPAAVVSAPILAAATPPGAAPAPTPAESEDAGAAAPEDEPDDSVSPEDTDTTDAPPVRPPSDPVPSPRSGAGTRRGPGPVSSSSPASPFGSKADTAQALRIVLGLTVLAILPALLVSLTSFLRIVIVLSMLRHAIGMNETPPNMVLTGLALFLTLFTMSPVIQRVDQESFGPFMRNELSVQVAYEKGMGPLREFMLHQTRESDLAFIVDLSKSARPRTMDDIGTLQLVPAFMLSELRAAFQIGFVVFLPFLLIDLIVSSILMALGMMMMPPTTISLPLKVLMFVLADGWGLLLKALVGSFH